MNGYQVQTEKLRKDAAESVLDARRFKLPGLTQGSSSPFN